MLRGLQRALLLLRQNERLLIIMVSTVLVMSGQGVISPVLPLFARSFGASAASIGLTLSIFGLARLLLNVPLGAMADRHGRRVLLVWGPLVSAVGMVGSGTATDIPTLLAWRFLAGAGSAMYMTGAQIYLIDISAVENRARYIGTNQGALLVGVSIGPGIGGLLAEVFGFRVPFFAVGGASLAAGIYAYLRLPETRQVAAERMAATHTRESATGSWRDVVGSRDFLAVALVTASLFLTRAGSRMTLMPLLAADQFGYSAGPLGLVFTAMAAINLLGLGPAAWAADRFGRKWAIVPSGLLIGSGLFLMAWSETDGYFLISAALLAVGSSVMGPAPAAYAADIAPPELRGLAMGLYRSAGDLGFVLGPLLLGALADASSVAWGLVANGAFAVFASLTFAAAARETVSRRQYAKSQPA
jgi:MFS family permease